ncbi:hypothetical protein FOV05_22255 [Salmonella enterica]|nr:hypothetical protein [Salmonella enterica]
MTIITREQQKQILIDTANHVISRDNTSPYSENLRELARIALASLETKSVVWTDASPAPVVPDDWRLVPKNPTGPMLAAGYQAYMKGQHRGRFYRSYQAMLEAAPKLSEVDCE